MLRCYSPVIAGLMVGVSPLLAAETVPTASPPAPLCPADLQDQIEQQLQRPDLARAQWGIFMQPLGAATPLIAYQADKLFIPASTQKLVTTGIALDVLGPDFQFQTPIYAKRSPYHRHQLQTLQIISSGDPTLQPADLVAIGTRLKTIGIRHIQQLQLVDPIPPEQHHRPSWEWDDLQYGYAPAVNQAILAGNQVTLTLTPQTVGEPLQMSWSEAIAASQWQVVNLTRTVVNPQSSLQIQQNRRQRTLTIRGELGPDANPDQTRLALPDPAQYFLDTLSHQLHQQGISVAKTQLRQQSRPLSTRPLLTLQSPPLSALIQTINQDSNNLYAEALWNQLLQSHSSQAATPLGKRRLQALGIPDTSLRIRDGSGLSRQNLISPRTLVQLLSVLAQSPHASTYRESLALAGESGTLKNRFRDSPLAGKIQAKTGTLTGVVTLAGFQTEIPLGTLVFSIIVNNSDLAPSVLRAAMDQILHWSAQVTPCEAHLNRLGD